MSQSKILIQHPFHLRLLFLYVKLKYSNSKLDKVSLFEKTSPQFRKLLASSFNMKEETISKLSGAPLKVVSQNGLGAKTLQVFVNYVAEFLPRLNSWEEFVFNFPCPTSIDVIMSKQSNSHQYFYALSPEVRELIDNEITKLLFPEKYSIEDFDITNMPLVDSQLIGREFDFKKLSEYLEEDGAKIIGVTGKMGMGKSSLVSHLVRRVKENGKQKFQTVLCWSFNFQNDEDTNADCEIFMSEALRFYRIDAQESSSMEKVKLLINHYSKNEHLLVLDGVESLNFTNNHELADDLLKLLLKLFDEFGKGKIILTSRIKLKSSLGFLSGFYELDLSPLIEEGSVKLLRMFNLKGSEEEFKSVAKKLYGHPFTIRYFAKRIVENYQSNLGILPNSLNEMAENDAALEKEFKIDFDQIENSKYLLFLISALYEQVSYSFLLKIIREIGEADRVAGLESISDIEVINQLNQLDRLGLIIFDQSNIYCFAVVSINCNEYLKKENPLLWTKINTLIYNFYKNSNPTDYRNEIVYFEKLFLALRHACHAGLYKESVEDVLFTKIYRQKEQYSFRVLGLVVPEIMALKGYFEVPFRKVKKEIDDYVASFLYNSIGFKFSAIAKLNEAIEATKASVEISIKLNENRNVSTNYINLSECHMFLGNLRKSKEYNELAISYLDKLLVKDDKLTTNTSKEDLANLRAIRQFQKARLHYFFEELEDYQDLYNKGIEIAIKGKVNPPILRGETAFYYSQYCFKNGEYQKAYNITMDSLENYSLKTEILYASGFDYTSLAQYYLLNRDYLEGMKSIKSAVMYFNKSRILQFLPYALIVRADLEIYLNRYEDAEATLNSINEIIFDELVFFQIPYYNLKSKLAEKRGDRENHQKYTSMRLRLMSDYGFENYFHSFE